MTSQKRATVVSSSVAGFLALMKLIVGLASNSVAVLASAIDSLLDLGASMFNYFALHNSEKEQDETFNYGRGKVEALAAVIEGTIITVSGLYILYESAKKAITGDDILNIEGSIIIMAVSFVITVMLVLYLSSVAKKTNNLVIRSDALHYKTDVLTNGAILLSLGIVYFSGYVFVDALLGGVIAIYIIYSAYFLIKEGVLMLLDRALDEETVERIREAIESDEDVSSYHFLKTRQDANHKYVDVHVVFGREYSLVRAHNAADRIEGRIAAIDKESDWVINIHLDPEDDSHLRPEDKLEEQHVNA